METRIIFVPEAATCAIDLLVTCAMNPTMEKMTKPANMLVPELMQQTMIESLEEINKKFTTGLKKHSCATKCSITHTLI